VGLEHIPPHELRLATCGTTSDVASNKTRFEKGDILFGKLRPYFRKCVQVSFSGVCSTDVWAITRIDDRRVDQSFLHWVVADIAFSEYANSAETGTRMPRANWGWVSAFDVMLPPLSDQLRIAELLDALDHRIESTRRLAETAGMLARAIVDTAPENCELSAIATASRVAFDPLRFGDSIVDHYSLPSFDSSSRPDRVRAETIGSGKRQILHLSVLVSRLNPNTNRTWLAEPSTEVDFSVCSTEYTVLEPQGTSAGLLWATVSPDNFCSELARKVTGTSSSHQRVREEDVLGILTEAEVEEAQAAIDVMTQMHGEIYAAIAMREFLLPKLLSRELVVDPLTPLGEAVS
jgi:type I restriction enzyme S subunit